MQNEKDLKLIIQIPCWNEEKILPKTIQDIPKEISGIANIEILIIDDGSLDNTVNVAKECGAKHIVKFTNHRGLAKAFAAGVDACLKLGADIIVNTDADNQYRGVDITKLIQPILDEKADMVIGARNIQKQKEFSLIKKKMQKLGSWVVRKLSGTNIEDATSGFRAYSADAAVKINIMSEYSYTLESIIQAGKAGIALLQVPIKTNAKTRESRLFKNMWHYVLYSIATIIKVYVIYQPLRVFFALGFIIFFAGFLIGLRFLYFFLLGNGGGHIQSLILTAILLILSFQMFVLGLITNIISANRFLAENILVKVKKNGFAGRQG